MALLGLSFAAMADPGNTQGGDLHGGAAGDAPVNLTIVTLQFDTADPGALLAVLSKYVVLTRMEPGCRNVDLCWSYTRPGRYLLIQKWDSPEAQRRHFDSPVMVEMATSCNGLLTEPPEIDLWDGPSAHDLR
jgi:quinol monooxygenase YgiN